VVYNIISDDIKRLRCLKQFPIKITIEVVNPIPLSLPLHQ
jgi:hypothetical protein